MEIWAASARGHSRFLRLWESSASWISSSRETWIHLIQTGWLSGFIVIKGLRVFCFWLQTHSAYEKKVSPVSASPAVFLFYRTGEDWLMRHCGSGGSRVDRREEKRSSSGAVAKMASVWKTLGKKWNGAELRYSTTENKTDVGLTDPLGLPSYLFISFLVY